MILLQCSCFQDSYPSCSNRAAENIEINLSTEAMDNLWSSSSLWFYWEKMVVLAARYTHGEFFWLGLVLVTLYLCLSVHLRQFSNLLLVATKRLYKSASSPILFYLYFNVWNSLFIPLSICLLINSRRRWAHATARALVCTKRRLASRFAMEVQDSPSFFGAKIRFAYSPGENYGKTGDLNDWVIDWLSEWLVD